MALQEQGQRQRLCARPPAPRGPLPAPSRHPQPGTATRRAHNPVAVAARAAPGRQWAPRFPQGVTIPLLAQEGRQQGPRGRATPRRCPGAGEPAGQGLRIASHGQLQVQGAPTGKSKETHQGGGGHGDRGGLPFLQCHPLAECAQFPKTPGAAAMNSPGNGRPAWLNWLILAAFLWSSWQLSGLWAARLHG